MILAGAGQVKSTRNATIQTNMTGDKVLIRPYRPEDYLSVKAIYQEGGLYDEFTDREEGLKDKISRDPGSILVAEEDQTVVGTVLIIEDARMALLFRLAVKGSERNRGIGKKLIAEAEKLLKHRGFKEVNLVVNDKNEELQSYYEKQGYKKHRSWRWMAKELS